MTEKQFLKSIRAKHLISFRRYLSLSGDGDSVIDFLSMNAFELRSYISDRWLSNMSWDNYREHWIVDHVVPMRYFDPRNLKDMKLCWNHNNLIPAYYWDNHAKGYCVDTTISILESMPQNGSTKLLLDKVSDIGKMFNKYRNG